MKYGEISVSYQAHKVMNVLLERKGYTTSKGLGELCKLNGAQVRVAVHELRCKGFIICSNKYGYWLASNIAEVDATIEHLQSRRDKIDKAIAGLCGGRRDYE